MELPQAKSALTPKSELPWSSRDAFIRLILFYGLLLVFMVTFQLGFTGLIKNVDDFVLEALIVGIIGVILTFIFLSFDGKKFSNIGFSLHSQKYFLLVVALIATPISLGLAYIIEIAGNVVSVDQMMKDRYLIENLASPDQFLNYFVVVIITFVGIAVGEEIMFRGYIQNILNSQLSFLKATAITSILFGFVHSFLLLNASADRLQGMVAVGVSATIFGFVFSYASKLTDNNLTLPILIHGVWDSIIFFFNTNYNYHDLINISAEIGSQLVAAIVLLLILYAVKRYSSSIN